MSDLWSKVDLHCRIQSLLETRLPRAFIGHVQVACIDGDRLVLCTDSPLWSSDLRYRSALILKSVNSCYGLNLSQCKILVRPQAFRHNPVPSKPPPNPARS
ncbi:DciA family protein [Oceanococcus atlanticus]|uniref:DciA family protein n=1 Tax=Oceanococcus atlanticus TaxID=1317117 RepID=UPI0009F8E0D6